VIRDGVVRYGAAASVPSRLEEAETLRASIVLVGHDGTIEQAARTAAETGIEVIAVVDGDAVEDIEGVEVVRTATRFSPGAVRNAGLRRSRGEIVVAVDTTAPFGHSGGHDAAPTIADAETVLRWLRVDGLTAIENALADPTVAVVGLTGYRSDDLRRFVPDGGGNRIAVGGPVVAFRRADIETRGPLDERLLTPGAVDIAWSLALREEGESAAPRRAVVLDPGPDLAVVPTESDARLPRRDAYRLAEQFADRRHLLAGSETD